MSETTGNQLFKALAQLQAKLPKIRKGETANVRSDKGSYSYKYADLADVSEELLPLMGSLGLAFTSRPTLTDGGQFVLAYSLVHTSGEREDGLYPLPSNGTPQAIGSAITYARRYSLCAVTGVAPGGDDDDASAAETSTRYSAGDAWNDSKPAPARQAGNGRQASRSPGESVPYQSTQDAADVGAIDEDAQTFAEEAGRARLPHEIEDIHRRAREAQKVTLSVRNPSSGGIGKLAVYLDWRKKQLEKAVRLDPEDPWAEKVADISDDAEGEAVIGEARELLGKGEIDSARYEQITLAVEARLAGLTQKAAA